MPRHLSAPFLATALGRGRAVVQLLSVAPAQGGRRVRWVSLRREADGYRVEPLESLVPADAGTRDLVAFLVDAPPDVDPDAPPEVLLAQRRAREGAPLATLEEALASAERTLGAHPARWVNEGMEGDEYAEALAKPAE